MPAERIAMRQVRDVLRLKAAGVSGNEIARRVGVASSTVRLTLKRLAAAGLGWPLPAEMTDAALEAQLFTAAGKKQGHRRLPEPDWAAVHRELKRKHVTLQILWDEYIEQHPDGYRYSRFCELYRGWASRISVTMRQTHAGGDKLFVDYAGDTVLVIVDRLTGEDPAGADFCRRAGRLELHLCRGELDPGARRLDRRPYKGVRGDRRGAQLLVPDNTKVAVIKACLYEPQVNRTYAEMAAHYDTAILPARPRRPRDKAKVEAAVLIVERWLWSAAPSPLLQPGRTERGDRRVAAPTQRRAADPPARRHPPRAARGTRPAISQGVAERALCLCRMAAAPRRRRLSRRGRGSLLQRALPLRPPRGRGAADAAHRRDLSQRRADRRASALQRQSPAHHRRRPHAVEPPALRRLDRRAHSPRGRRDRSGNGRVVRADPGAPAPSGTGLPLLPRHRASAAAVRRRSSRSSGDARHRDRHADLRLGAFDPRQQARSPGRHQPATPTPFRSSTPTSAVPATTINPSRRMDIADPSNA